METVKSTDNYTIFKKKNGRFGVRSNSRKWINGDEKIKILVSEGLLKVAAPSLKKEEAPEEAATAEE